MPFQDLASFWPRSSPISLTSHLLRINHYIFDGATVVSVSYMDQSVFGLDDCWVGVSVFNVLVLQCHHRLPSCAVPRQCEVQDISPFWLLTLVGTVVIDQKLASVLKCYCICSRVGIRKVRRGHCAPGDAAIF